MSKAACPLSPLEAGFLYAESARAPMHIGSIGLFEGPPLRDRDGLRTEAVRAEVERRLHLVPKLRRCVRFAPLGSAAPVWVDDPNFEVSNHVRGITLPPPGRETALRDLCGELLARPLRRDRPLWEIWLIDGLENGQVAMLEKLHHSMADGLAAVELVTVLFDLDRHPATHHQAHPWKPVPPPPQSSVVAQDLGRRGSFPLRVMANGVRALRNPVGVGREIAHYAEALGSVVRWQSIAPPSSLNVPIGEAREVAFVRQSEPVQHPWRLHHLETRMETWQTRARSSRPRSGIQMS